MKLENIKFRIWDKDIIGFVPWEVVNKDTFAFYEKENRQKLAHDGVETMVFEQFTGIKDSQGNDIYEGDIVAEVLPTISDNELRKSRNIFEVKSGNYASGKWIAKEVNHGNFGVNNYLFSNEMLVIGNIHENAELLEDEQ